MPHSPAQPTRRAPWLRIALLAAGVALFTWLIVTIGAEDLLAGLSTIGWGLVLVVAYRLVPLTAHTLGWRAVIPGRTVPRLPALMWMRLVCESANSLLPVAQVGGELLRARMLALAGTRGPLAGASVVVDFSMGLMTQAAFALLGVALLIPLAGGSGPTWALLLAVGGAGLVIALLLLAQQLGLFHPGARLIARVVRGEGWRRVAGNARRLDQAVKGLYDRRERVLRDLLWRMSGWLAGVGETWLTLWLLGQPVGLAEAVVLESLAYAVRSMGFAVPGALGVQEGGLVLVGALLGLEPSAALTLSVVKRLREITLGVPALAAWTLRGAR